MINLFSTNTSSDAGILVLAALQRVVTRTQAQQVTATSLSLDGARILVVINPDDTHVARIRDWKQQGPGKLILLGRLPQDIAHELGLKPTQWPDQPEHWSRSPAAPSHGMAESPCVINYTSEADIFQAAHWKRPLERFDFTSEWNNLGYGAIRCDESHWSLAQPYLAQDTQVLANVELDGKSIATYALLKDESTCSTLWFNRAVGPIDSFEWRIVEQFLSSWRHQELPCQPILTEIPWGCEAAVTMRLDCDEDIESARALRELYQTLGVPFTLAVHTKNLQDPTQHILLKEMAAAGESILSHTATHAPNWGGSYEAALAEGRESISKLASVTGQTVRYAVSPFHQTPAYALAGLSDAGLSGCIGGIICNDPEFLIARGGLLAGMPDGFIGHSQQHMLHGECLLASDDPLAISKQAFDRARETRTLFGYLDHPFSPRYQYGWSDEKTRCEMHRAFITYIKDTTPEVCFLSESDAMDFLLTKSRWQIMSDNNGYQLYQPKFGAHSPLIPTVEYAGQRFAAHAGRIPQ
jgi:peptidoglycan/xylan/chitin deacetylase (PgdA/CDA1 family)